MSGLDPLWERRYKMCTKFALKAAANPKFSHWFPLQPESGYSLRDQKKYVEFPARTSRLRAAPLFYFRRLLNALDDDEG